MANIAIFRINYKSDFILTLNSDAGWLTPFCIKFWTGAPSQAYFVGFDGTTYTHCAPVDGEPTKLLVQFDDHHLPIGDLKFQIGYHFTVADFPTSIEDEVINQAAVIINNDGEQQKVMLDFNGETAPEIEFSLPAYANEAQRIANESQRIANEEQRIATETQRIANEEQRISQEQTRQQNEVQRIVQEQARVTAERERFNDYAKLKVDAIAATDAANSAADLANEKAQLAADEAQLAADKAALAQSASALATEKAQLATDKAALAQSAATLANDKAALAQQKAEYATAQGDYAKAQGDYAKAQAGVIPTDVTRTQTDATFVNGNNDPLFYLRQSTSSLAGLMTAAEHTKLNDMPSAQEVNAGLAYDVSVLHPTSGVSGGSTYASLSAALAVIPQDKRKGGMTVKFVLSSDNKYVQYRLMSDSFSTTESDWQGVDDEPTAGSENLVKSGGVAEGIGKLPLQLFDGIVNSNGVWQLGSNKQHFLIPVNGGESVVFDAASNYMYCAFLKTYATPVAGATPDFCSGYEGRQGRSESSAFTIPSDCRYFIIDIGESSYIPTLLKINGIDITNGIYGCIFGIGENLNTINDKLLSFSYMQLGGICAGTGTAPIDRVINYDSSLQAVTLPQDIIFLYKSIGGTTDYKSISATTLDVSKTAIATSAIKIVYDKSDDTIKALPYNTKSTESQYLIAGLRRSPNVRYCSFVTSFPWAIDKIPYGIEESDLVLHTVQNACVPPIVGGYINYDSLKNTLTIPRNIIVKAKNIGQGNTNYLETSSEIVLNVPQSTSAIILVYDKNDETFKFVSYSHNITPTQYFILGLRSGLSVATPAITSLFPWSINGCPYNIKIHNFEGRRAFVNGVNHQGFNRVAPANTLPAFKLSAKQGFKFVETDVRFTSDGVAVLLHDETINATARNSDGTALESPVYIADITYEEVLEYDFGIWKGEEYAGTKIPTFEEFIVLCRNLGLSPYVEVKLGTQQQIDGLFAIVDKYGMLKHTTWITTGETYLDRIVSSPYPKYRIGYVIVPIDISDEIIAKVLSVQNAAEEVFIDGNVNMLTPTGIDKCKNNGIPLEVFTINRSNISLADNDYYSGFTSDEIDISTMRYEDGINPN